MGTMPTTNLLTTQEAIFTVSADDGTTSRPAGFSAQVSPYANAYVALVGGNTLHLVPKQPGASTVTINGHSQDGTPLPPVSLSFNASLPPVPQATEFVLSTPSVSNQNITTPGDPGTDTVTGTV